MSLYIGIDPGFRGAFAVLGPEGDDVRQLVSTPVTNSKPPEYLDGAMADLVVMAEPEIAIAAVERAQAMPRQGVRSMFSIGLGYGLWRGVLAAHGVRCELLRPQDWRKAVGLPTGADKGASVALASRLFPSVAAWLRGPRGGLNDGMAEALLIADALRRRTEAGQ